MWHIREYSRVARPEYRRVARPEFAKGVGTARNLGRPGVQNGKVSITRLTTPTLRFGRATQGWEAITCIEY